MQSGLQPAMLGFIKTLPSLQNCTTNSKRELSMLHHKPTLSFMFALLLFLSAFSNPTTTNAATNQQGAVVRSAENYLNPAWIEERLSKVGIDKLIEEYKGFPNKDVQTVRRALDLSRHILRQHPEMLRMQLQARLTLHKKSLPQFQKLPSKGIQIQSHWRSFNEPQGALLRTITPSQKEDYFIEAKFIPAGLKRLPDRESRYEEVKEIVVTTIRGEENNEFSRLTIWDVETATLNRETEEIKGGISCLDISSDGKMAVTGSYSNNLITIWNLETGKIKQQLKGHTKTVNHISLTPDDLTIVSGSEDKTLKIWHVKTGKLVRTFKEHTAEAFSLDVSPDGTSVVSFAFSEDHDIELKVWNISTGKVTGTYSPENLVDPETKIFHLGSSLLYSGDSTLHEIGLSKPKQKSKPLKLVFPIRFFINGKPTWFSKIPNSEIASKWRISNIAASKKKTALLIDTGDGEIAGAIRRANEIHITGAFLKCGGVFLEMDVDWHGDKVLICDEIGNGGSRVLIYSIYQSNRNLLSSQPLAHKHGVAAVAITPDGKHMISAGKSDKQIQVRDIDSSQLEEWDKYSKKVVTVHG